MMKSVMPFSPSAVPKNQPWKLRLKQLLERLLKMQKQAASGGETGSSIVIEDGNEVVMEGKK